MNFKLRPATCKVFLRMNLYVDSSVLKCTGDGKGDLYRADGDTIIRIPVELGLGEGETCFPKLTAVIPDSLLTYIADHPTQCSSYATVWIQCNHAGAIEYTVDYARLSARFSVPSRPPCSPYSIVNMERQYRIGPKVINRFVVDVRLLKTIADTFGHEYVTIHGLQQSGCPVRYHSLRCDEDRQCRFLFGDPRKNRRNRYVI